MRTILLSFVAVGCSEYDLAGGKDTPTPTGTSPGGTETTPASPPACVLDDPSPYAVDPNPACVGEPVIGSFTPVVEWTWASNPIHPGFDQIMSTPMVANLTDDDGDGDVDRDDVPDVVFTTFAGGGYTSPGAITAISGLDGSTIWSVVDANGHQPYASGGIAIGDLEGDGRPEVVVASPSGLLCLEADGGFSWVAAVPPLYIGLPSIADLEGDGLAEVVYGPAVVGHDGAIRWIGGYGTGGPWYGSFAVDLDLDGTLEIVAGNTVYEHDGALRWTDGYPDGTPAVADFDLDGAPEIVRVYAGTVHLADTDGTLLWTFPLYDGGGGPPTVADFDGDGLPEVGVASRQFYRVIDTDGTELWANVVQDFSSAVTGSSVFDFEGDGAAEVVYADEETLWVYDGATGAIELQWASHSSGTLIENPVIVDVDRDGATEIVVASNDYAFAGSRGITIVGDAADSWAPARPVWNQHAYHITNIGDDGDVPLAQAPNWASWNSFRAGNSETAVGLEQPDWRVVDPTTCTVECADGRAWAWFPVENEGAADGGTVDVTVARGDGSVVDASAFVVPVGGMSWVGPVRFGPEDFAAGPVSVTAAGDFDCDPSDNTYVWATYPCP